MTPFANASVRRCVKFTATGSKRAVLFGSRARGDARADSDYDVAVFLRDMGDRFAEMDRLADLSTDILGAGRKPGGGVGAVVLAVARALARARRGMLRTPRRLRVPRAWCLRRLHMHHDGPVGREPNCGGS